MSQACVTMWCMATNRTVGRAEDVRELTAEQALRLRMTSLLLPSGDGGSTNGGVAGGGVAGGDVAGVVEWLGAMQAQDLASALWSFGVRLPGYRLPDVEAALERRQALRTWPMRGTVHFVPARDARWMVELLGARPLANAAARRARLDLSEQTADRAVETLRQALAGGRRLTRAQCVAALAEAGIDHSGQRGYHLLWYASQVGVTCITPNVAGEQTFALLDEWVPDPVRLERDDALATMARRYFRSHGPASQRDFVGWTGLTAADAKRGIAAAADALVTVRVAGQPMIMGREVLEASDERRCARPEPPPHGEPAAATLALPGFDEYMLGFKDRTLMMNPSDLDAVVPGGNGVFRATVVHAGRVAATWTRTVTRTRVTIDVHPLAARVGPAVRCAAEAALSSYGEFLGLPVVVRWS